MKTCNFNSNISVREETISGLKLKFKTWQSFIQVLLIFEGELLGRYQNLFMKILFTETLNKVILFTKYLIF